MSGESLREMIERAGSGCTIVASGGSSSSRLPHPSSTASPRVDSKRPAGFDTAPRPPRTIDDTIAPELEQVCLKCLSKSAAERYTTAADLARDLRRWLDRQGAARPQTSWRRWGTPLAVGVAVANAILLVTFAEHGRQMGRGPLDAAIDAARSRMRPVLMTSAAMIAGMIPMALALGQGAEATAPLGRAVIGGLAAATFATLIVLPSVYSLVQQSARVASPSLDPDDPQSPHREQRG